MPNRLRYAGSEIPEKSMASVALEQVRSKALGLSEIERAELAHDLVVSLDGQADSQAATEWDAESLRRLSQVDAGTEETIDRAEFVRRMDLLRIGPA